MSDPGRKKLRFGRASRRRVSPSRICNRSGSVPNRPFEVNPAIIPRALQSRRRLILLPSPTEKGHERPHQGGTLR